MAAHKFQRGRSAAGNANHRRIGNIEVIQQRGKNIALLLRHNPG